MLGFGLGFGIKMSHFLLPPPPLVIKKWVLVKKKILGEVTWLATPKKGKKIEGECSYKIYNY